MASYHQQAYRRDPIALIAGQVKTKTMEYAKTLDRAAKDVGVNFIGGFSSWCIRVFQGGPDIDKIHPKGTHGDREGLCLGKCW